MPLYDYDCAACGRRFELIHGVHAEPPTVCPLCGSGPIRKTIVAPAIHYKGSGWAKKERRATVKSSTAKAGDDGSGDGDGPKPSTTSGSDGETSDAGSAAKKTSTPTSAAPAD
ncbi:MAG: FmdB family zinc ribbon protein [Candidatus Limnocylindrales bacterium]